MRNYSIYDQLLRRENRFGFRGGWGLAAGLAVVFTLAVGASQGTAETGQPTLHRQLVDQVSVTQEGQNMVLQVQGQFRADWQNKMSVESDETSDDQGNPAFRHRVRIPLAVIGAVFGPPLELDLNGKPLRVEVISDLGDKGQTVPSWVNIEIVGLGPEKPEFLSSSSGSDRLVFRVGEAPPPPAPVSQEPPPPPKPQYSEKALDDMTMGALIFTEGRVVHVRVAVTAYAEDAKAADTLMAALTQQLGGTESRTGMVFTLTRQERPGDPGESLAGGTQVIYRPAYLPAALALAQAMEGAPVVRLLAPGDTLPGDNDVEIRVRSDNRSLSPGNL
ncbi:MAG: hypothetical protein OEV94_03245 [Deltaproteobacteria bacterium]|nr:hypothetical protein [Deltaproteobacteria bacterium]